MKQEPVIRVSGLSKAYRIGQKYQSEKTIAGRFKKMLTQPVENFKKIRGLKDLQFANDDTLIWALRDINLEMHTGEVLGIIGKNGSGKSTLLKLLSRITYPTSGTIEMAGRASSLLEVGTGFNPELTGRENIFLNGTLLGMTTKEVKQQFDEIVVFSGVEKFIDTPVKRYSSGMKVRLAFAVAAHLEPDILIIDEVLAVGDAEFQKKCIGKMQQVANESGRTVLFVSHDMLAVQRLCSRCVLLESGLLVMDDTPDNTVTHYIQKYNLGSNRGDLNVNRTSLKSTKFSILSVQILANEGNKAEFVKSGDLLKIRLHYEYYETPFNPIIILFCKNHMGQVLFTLLSRNSFSGVMDLKKNGFIECQIPRLPLQPGEYQFDVTIKYDSEIVLKGEDFFKLVVQEGDFFDTGRINKHFKNGLFVYHSWVVE